MNDKVSVAICTFNGSKFISDQLASIINQTKQPDEIIICDDMSSDNTVEIIESILKKTHIDWLMDINNPRLGVTKNFEKAISMCKGDIIFTSDQDDYWAENKIERTLEEFFNDPEVSLVFSNAELVDSDLKKLPGDLWLTTNFSDKKLQKDKTEILELLLNHNFVTGATMAFRSKVLHKFIPIPNGWMHDYWIAIHCLIDGKIVAIPEKLILYKQHDSNVLGAKKLSLINKAKKYLANFNRLNEIRNEKVNMFHDLACHFQGQKTELKIINEINSCYDFWNRRAALKSSSKSGGVKEIIVDLINNKYSKYYTGFRGATRDLLAVLIGPN